MTPSDTTVKRPTDRQRRDDDLAELIVACGRDERPALQTLYRRTAGKLYGLALAAADDRALAERALVQTYLEVFGEAASFDPDQDQALTWLTTRLARQLPEMARLGKASAVKPVDPPAELWQKLDIGLGLKRLDRHIKPGIATQPRGRDPMPNAHDRRIDRRVRFWRVAAAAGCLAFLAAMGGILTLGLQGGPAGLLTGALAPDQALPEVPATAAGDISAPPPSAGVLAIGTAATGAETAVWLAILQPAAGSRLWRVHHASGMLEITAMPPFALADTAARPAAGDRGQRLVLWAVAGVTGDLRHLGTLDPASTTSVALPADLDREALAFIVSLEPGEPVPGAGPSGPLLFAGGRQP